VPRNLKPATRNPQPSSAGWAYVRTGPRGGTVRRWQYFAAPAGGGRPVSRCRARHVYRGSFGPLREAPWNAQISKISEGVRVLPYANADNSRNCRQCTNAFNKHLREQEPPRAT